MEILITFIYIVSIYLILKYVKSELLEIGLLTAITIISKLLIDNGSFYPIFALPVFLSLRYSKPYVLIYSFLSLLGQNVIAGIGIWSLIQFPLLLGMSLLFYLLKDKILKLSKPSIMLLNFVAMFLFGVLMDALTFTFGNFLGYSSVWEQIAIGLPFDLKYGVSALFFGSVTMLVAHIVNVGIHNVFTIKGLRLAKGEI